MLITGVRYFWLVWHLCYETCKPCRPFQLALRFRLAYMYIVHRLAQWYIMLLAVSFVLGLGFSGLLKFKASRIFIFATSKCY